MRVPLSHLVLRVSRKHIVRQIVRNEIESMYVHVRFWLQNMQSMYTLTTNELSSNFSENSVHLNWELRLHTRIYLKDYIELQKI